MATNEPLGLYHGWHGSKALKSLEAPLKRFINFPPFALYSMNNSEKNCIICGTPLYGRADKTTCSDACWVRLCRQRQNESSYEINEEDEKPQTGHDAPLDFPRLKPQPIASTEREYQNRWDTHDDQVDTAEQKRSNEVAFTKQIHGHYVNVVESFLENEHQRLHAHKLRRMLRFATEAHEACKLHPQLT